MIREKFWFHSSAGLGVVQVNADKALCNASFLSLPEPRQIKQGALGSQYLQITWVRLLQQWRRPGSKDNTHSVHLLMFVSPRRLDQLSRFHRWVDLALLFKKGVGREIAVLEVAWLTCVFSNVQHSRNPVLKFCGRRTAGDLSQSTINILRPELFPGGSVFAAWKNAALLPLNFVVLDGESYSRGRLTSRRFSATCSPVWLPRKTTSPSKRIKSSSPPQQSSHTWLQKLVEASDARATGRRSLS